MGCYPNLPRKYWLITPVDYIAQVICMSVKVDFALQNHTSTLCLCDSCLRNNGSTKCFHDIDVNDSLHHSLDTFHLTPETKDELSNNELFETLASFGYKLKCIGYHDWLAMVMDILDKGDIEHPLYGVGTYLTEKVYNGRHSIMAMHHHTPNVTCHKLYKYIDTYSTMTDIKPKKIVWSKDMLRQYIDHYIDQGWFPKV
ncbi:hypothetical protein D3C87_1367140 [compost metagenome]